MYINYERRMEMELLKAFLTMLYDALKEIIALFKEDDA